MKNANTDTKAFLFVIAIVLVIIGAGLYIAAQSCWVKVYTLNPGEMAIVEHTNTWFFFKVKKKHLVEGPIEGAFEKATLIKPGKVFFTIEVKRPLMEKAKKLNPLRKKSERDALKSPLLIKGQWDISSISNDGLRKLFKENPSLNLLEETKKDFAAALAAEIYGGDTDKLQDLGKAYGMPSTKVEIESQSEDFADAPKQAFNENELFATEPPLKWDFDYSKFKKNCMAGIVGFMIVFLIIAKFVEDAKKSS